MPPPTDGNWSAATPFAIHPVLDDGYGRTLPPPGDTRGLFVLHAVLLKTGRVLCFCGHAEFAYYPPKSYVFDPTVPAALMAPIDFPANMDLFCCHYVQIPDGRILVVGGSDKNFPHHGSRGAKNIAIFDPDTESWSQAMTGGVPNELRQGRWYPTPLLLPDGRVFVASGRPEAPPPPPPPPAPPPPPPPIVADMVEILSPPNWSTTELVGATLPLPIYPGLHLAPNGRIHFTHTNWGQEIPDPGGLWIEVPTGGTAAAWTPHGNMPAQPRREEGMSVLLPLVRPGREGRILVIGGTLAETAPPGNLPTVLHGGNAGFDHVHAFTDAQSAEILDTTPNPPTWSSAGTMAHGRTNGHCVLLPDATVLICGGHDGYKWQATSGLPVPTTPSLVAEIYTHGTGFRTVAEMHTPRMYHSVALLLPDGHVWCAGGADPNRGEPTLAWPPNWGVDPLVGPGPLRRTYGARALAPGTRLGYRGMALNDKTFEFYKPPYFFNGARPAITDVTINGTSVRRIEYGQTFKIVTPQAATTNRVAIMRPGAPTHHTDTEQRYVELDFTAQATELTVTMINDEKLAPPGFYMLWIVTPGGPNGLPCALAPFVHLVPRTPAVRPPNTSKCAFLTVMGTVNHVSVLYLRMLRERLAETTAAGNYFIRAVNRVYGWISPSLVRSLAKKPLARKAVRECFVQPAVKVIAASDRATRKLPEHLRSYALMSLLTLEGLASIAAAPLLLAVIGARIAGARIVGERHA